MKSILNQKGSAHLAVIFGVILVAVVAFAGYRVMNNNKDKTAKTSDSSLTATVPNKIENKSDLEKASTALDQTGTLDADQLDSDLNSIL